MDPRRGDLTFTVLGDSPFVEECRDIALTELAAAGFPRDAPTVSYREVEVMVEGSPAERAASAGIYVPSAVAAAPKEWKKLYRVEAKLAGWKFCRAWYYWIAEAQEQAVAIPAADAIALNQSLGTQLRVEGYAGGQDDSSCIDGVSLYHVDTPAALAALVAAITRLDAARIAACRAAWNNQKLRGATP